MEVLADSAEGLSFSAVCAQLDLPRSSAHALLSTMTERSFVVQDPQSGAYTLGSRLWELANRTRSSVNDLTVAARPYMEQVRDAVDEVVELGVLDGTDVVYIGRCDAQQLLTLVSRVGARLPAHATAVGKALLSTLPPQKVAQLYEGHPFNRYTPQTLGSLRALQNELATVRTLGYAEARGDYTEGVYCIAMPVLDRDDDAVAAMSTSVPTTRGTPERIGLMSRELRAAVQDLSLRLGHHTKDTSVQHGIS